MTSCYLLVSGCCRFGCTTLRRGLTQALGSSVDYRLPIAIAIALSYSVWLAWHTLKDPDSSEEKLSEYATYALLIGLLFFSLEVISHIGKMPISEILQARMQHTRDQATIAFSYACLTTAVVFWIASTRSKR